MEITEKSKILQNVISQLEKTYGKNTIMKMDASIEVDPSQIVPTGSYLLNEALGVGGIKRGKIVEIYGPESSGKTTLALHLISESQKKGDICAFIDAEHALDINYAARIGVDINDLLVSQPDNGEMALEIADKLIEGGVKMVVIDSVAALVPRAELEGEMGDSHMGLQARLMSQGLRKLTGICSKKEAIIIFINQIRQKIGVMYGSNETTTGGNALKFYASIRMEVRRISTIEKGDEKVGNRVKIKIVKNKVAPPYKEIETSIIFGQGLDVIGELVDFAVKEEIIEKSGSWFVYKDTRVQGMNSLLEIFRNKPEELESLKNKFLEVRGKKVNTKTEEKKTKTK